VIYSRRLCVAAGRGVHTKREIKSGSVRVRERAPWDLSYAIDFRIAHAVIQAAVRGRDTSGTKEAQFLATML